MEKKEKNIKLCLLYIVKYKMQAVKQQSILSCKNVYLNNENIFLFKLMNRGVVDKIIAAQRCPHPDP